jgi:hypothetical protein
VSFYKNIAKISSCGVKAGSVTPLTALLNQKLDTFQILRMLTPSEMELLRKRKLEMALMTEVFPGQSFLYQCSLARV